MKVNGEKLTRASKEEILQDIVEVERELENTEKHLEPYYTIKENNVFDVFIESIYW